MNDTMELNILLIIFLIKNSIILIFWNKFDDLILRN